MHAATETRIEMRPPPRRGLSEAEAAAYVGVGTTKFGEMVRDGRMPRPKRIDGRVVWDIIKLDIHFENLPGDETSNNSTWKGI